MIGERPSRNAFESDPMEGYVRNIRAVLPNALFHHTVSAHEMTYGGLHKTQAGAKTARDELVCTGHQHLKNGPIIKLPVGQAYQPWGTGNTFRHGVDDGTHSSEIQIPGSSNPLIKIAQRLLRV